MPQTGHSHSPREIQRNQSRTTPNQHHKTPLSPLLEATRIPASSLRPQTLVSTSQQGRPVHRSTTPSPRWSTVPVLQARLHRKLDFKAVSSIYQLQLPQYQVRLIQRKLQPRQISQGLIWQRTTLLVTPGLPSRPACPLLIFLACLEIASKDHHQIFSGRRMLHPFRRKTPSRFRIHLHIFKPRSPNHHPAFSLRTCPHQRNCQQIKLDLAKHSPPITPSRRETACPRLQILHHRPTRKPHRIRLHRSMFRLLPLHRLVPRISSLPTQLPPPQARKVHPML